MKTIKLLTVAAVALAASPVLASDISIGTVLAFDRKAKTLVLSDHTVWSLEESSLDLPDGLAAGDKVQIEYEGGEEGVAKISDIKILRETLREGARDVTEGTVLAYDRKAGMLVFTDRTAWSLHDLKGKAPDGLKAGDRVRIEYESDEDGISEIKEITRL